MRMKLHFALIAGLAAVPVSGVPAMAFDRVQPPELAVGKRASLAGSLASTTFGPADVTRGGFSLPTPFVAPKDRGELPVQVFPTYGPDNGISPWGMGFAASLAITRSRISGSLAYDFTKGDELVSPFGRLTRGTDGNWYPTGLEKPIRVVPSGDELVAYLSDGSRWTFGGIARVVTAAGTYAWNLREVVDAVGHVSTLTWVKNASGNAFLTQVDYGGRATSQYRIELAYEPVTLVDSRGVTRPRFVDYRSGAPLALDQRVKTVTVRARNAATSSFDERYHYTLSYTQEQIGAAFYLTRIDTTYASKESAPPVTYTYNLKGADFGTSALQEVPQLTALFGALGVTSDVIQPSRAAVADADFDGNADLELGDNARTLLSQKGSGTANDPLHFEVSTVPAASAPACKTATQTGCVFNACRPTGSPGTLLPPRLLSQLNPTDTTLQVVAFQYNSDAGQTAISVCSRDGVRVSVNPVSSNWQASNLVRFVDLDNDHLPDLIRVGFGRYDVLPNVSQISGAGASFGWGARISGVIHSSQGASILPDDAWVSDVSGDGVPDLVARYGDSLQVWHGLGNFQFTTTAEELRFFKADGTAFTSFAHYKIIPADLNKDGLQDYFVTNADGDTTNSRFIQYFTNVGGRFVQTPIHALDHLSFTASAPVIATLDGSGNMSVTVTDSGKAFSVALDGPGTGLMATADDGKGTRLSFEYARGPASPGIRHRYALLSAMHVQASGYDTVSYDYAYSQPTVHSVGHFLVGFDQVARREGDLPAAPLGASTMSFLNGDHWSGLLVSGRQTDARLPDVVKVETRAYADATFQGIPYKRLASSTSGWTSADGARKAVDTTTYDAYASEFCPSHTTLTTASHGTLVTETTRANPANLATNLHCLEAAIVQTGTHTDATWNFRQERRIARNDAGRITQIALLGDAGPLVEEQVAYDNDNDPISITIPGKGITFIDYDAATKLFNKVTSPDGVVTQIAARDPVTDATLTVVKDRGGLKFTEYASYDGLERLATHWTDLDGSSALTPSEHYTYSYASTNHPATVGTHRLVDSATGAYRDTMELFTAAEEKLGTAQLHDTAWVFDGFLARSRATRVTDHFEVASLPPDASFSSIDYATLLQGSPAKISTSSASILEAKSELASSTRLHADVTKVTASTLAVTDDGTLTRSTLVNNDHMTTEALDPTTKLRLAYVDEANTQYRYGYDALGRIRLVTLPDGTHHGTTYDAYGRVVGVSREGIANVANSYLAVGDGTTDLVSMKTFSSAPGDGAPVALRTVAYTYDASARKLVETHTDLSTNATKSFHYFYDGATGPTPSTAVLRGFLTGVTGDGYTKTFNYRPDGKVAYREVAIAGFRTIGTAFSYREDGTIRDQTITVRDSLGNLLETSAHHTDVDAFGRPAKASVNGALLATTTYDALGRPDKSTFSTGDSVTFAYDALTREAIGFDQVRAGGAWSGAASTRVKKNDRGFVGQELLGVGTASVLRSYSYSPQGFLTSASDGVAP